MVDAKKSSGEPFLLRRMRRFQPRLMTKWTKWVGDGWIFHGFFELDHRNSTVSGLQSGSFGKSTHLHHLMCFFFSWAFLMIGFSMVFHGFSMGILWCSMGFPWVFHGCSMGFLWLFGCLKHVPLRLFKDVAPPLSRAK